MNNTPQDRIRIFNRQGFPIAEFRAWVERSWVIGEEGRARFTYATRKGDVVNEDALQFGNWLLVESDSLPAWVGVLDIPRTWGARTVTLSAYTPEHIFSQRRGPLEEVYNKSAGEIFQTLIAKVNSAEATIIQAGSIYTSGAMQETLNPTPLNEDLKRIFDRSGNEYQWRPVVSNGRLTVYADWLLFLGEDTSGVLQSGVGGGNVEATADMMIEDGPIINDLLAYGDGQTWAGKPVANVQNLESIGRYGLRQAAVNYSGVVNVTTLIDNGTYKINAEKQPQRTFKINALNLGDTFKSIALGNRLTLRYEKIGFQGGTQYQTRIRILGMHYNPDDKNVIGLVVKELL